MFPIFLYVFSVVTPVIQKKDGHLLGSDFSYYLLLVNTFWHGEINEIYSLSAYQTAIGSLAPDAISPLAMPLAITPASVILLWPFTFLLRWGYPAAQALWVSFSLSFLVIEFAKLYRATPKITNSRWLLLMAFLVFFGSSEFYIATTLGQTSIFALASLTYLTIRHKSFNNNSSASSVNFFVWPWPIYSFYYSLTPSLIITLLSFKPHYWIFALLLVLAKMDYHVVFWGVVLSVLLQLAGVSFMSSDWFIHYLESTSVFLQSEIPAVYLAAFAPAMMNLYVTATSDIIPSKTSLSQSRLILALITLAAGALLSLPLISTSLRKIFSLDRLLTTPQSRLALALTPLLGYMLFAPYAGHYEDLLLLSPLLTSLTLAANPLTNHTSKKLISYFLIIALVPLLSFNILPEPKPRIILWLLKSIFSFVVLISILWPRRNNHSLEIL
ncbi:MAG: hypothetical protein PHC51_14480 [bacterium]|nr:hypothetical protein [bacterium]